MRTHDQYLTEGDRDNQPILRHYNQDREYLFAENINEEDIIQKMLLMDLDVKEDEAYKILSMIPDKFPKDHFTTVLAQAMHDLLTEGGLEAVSKEVPGVEIKSTKNKRRNYEK